MENKFRPTLSMLTMKQKLKQGKQINKSKIQAQTWGDSLVHKDSKLDRAWVSSYHHE